MKWNTYSLELKESEDEKIRKWLIGYFRQYKEDGIEKYANGLKVESIIAWLEKQGQKPQNKTAFETTKEENVDNANKVEPKFHKGDWVVYNNDICQIVKREEGCNKLVTVFGIEKELVNERNLSTARLWTIKDAKDGDVLSDGTTIFIFKDLLSDGSVMSYCDYDTDSGESDDFCPVSVNLMCSKITPATKEQRDILFTKMREKGYEWDAEKKELKKVVQKPAWSEEDEHTLQGVIDEIQANKSQAPDYNLETYDRFLSWLKSLKERISEKPKEEVDGFDAELNALLKKYEYLPKEELAECLEFYLGVVNKSEAEMVGMEGLGKIWDEKKDPILQRLDKIFDVLTEIKINTVLRQPYITSDPPQPIQPWYGTETVTCGE